MNTDPDRAHGGAVSPLPARVVLATMHGKQDALAPAFAARGVTLVVPPSLDTDIFGTFSGDVARMGTMVEAARAKLAAATRISGLSVGLASEGAYGPHPAIPFLAVGHEILLWRDMVTGHEVVETIIDDAPCYDQAQATDLAGLAAFLSRVGFPDTALCVAPDSARSAPVAKGLRSMPALGDAVARAVARCPNGMAFVQTDMRAFMNPRRMAIIARLGDKLAARLARPCPSCAAPGWGMVRTQRGLPCRDCGLTTGLVAHEVHGCTACGAETIMPRSDGKTAADPQHCDFCNP